MLLKEQWMQIHVLKAQGLSLREIAERVNDFAASVVINLLCRTGSFSGR